MIVTDKSLVITFAIPVFFILMLVEYFYGRSVGKNTYRLNDTFTSVAIGMISRYPTMLNLGQSCHWQRAPVQPASHWQWPGLTHVPWAQPDGQTGFSQSSPLHPSLHTHMGLPRRLAAADEGSAQWPWPEQAVAPQYGWLQSSPRRYGLGQRQPLSVHSPFE